MFYRQHVHRTCTHRTLDHTVRLFRTCSLKELNHVNVWSRIQWVLLQKLNRPKIPLLTWVIGLY